MSLELCGWAGEDRAEEVWQAIGSQFPDFLIVGAGNEDVTYRMLWEITREVLGKDPPNVPQLDGDCVAQAAQRVIEQVQCQEIKAGDAEEWHPIFAPYLYGTGRVQVGGGQMRGSAGSVGSWQAKAVELYGAVPADAPGVPKYSKAISVQYGNNGPPKELLEMGKKHLIQTTSRIRSRADLKIALQNWYGCTVASNQGFEMMARSDGYHYPSGSWPHQMSIIGFGVDERGVEYACVLNSWGDVHGKVKDFKSGVIWPVGSMRVKMSVIDGMIGRGEVFAYSRFQGFPTQTFSFSNSI